MNQNVPDRKWWANGIAGAVSAGIVFAGNTWLGWQVDEVTAMAIVGLVGLVAHYFVPMSVIDIAKRSDDDWRKTFDDAGNR